MLTIFLRANTANFYPTTKRFHHSMVKIITLLREILKTASCIFFETLLYAINYAEPPLCSRQWSLRNRNVFDQLGNIPSKLFV